MIYELGWLILAIFFWVLLAVATVLAMAWVYIQVQYYHWEKQDRHIEETIRKVIDEVNDILNANSGGNEQE